MFEDIPIDEVIIDPSETPYGYGIGRCTSDAFDSRSNGEPWKEVWAITGCCKERVIVDHGSSSSTFCADWPWQCAGCSRQVMQPFGAPDPEVSIFVFEGRSVGRGSNNAEEWVSQWTGVSVKQVSIKIKK